MIRTLLTGFGPFRNVVDNPSARIVAHFARAGAPGHALTTRVLPVSFAEAGREVGALLTAGAFDVALLMGVASREPGFRLEQFGRYSDPDADAGARPNPDSYPCHLVLEPIQETLEAAGVPARLSTDAGSYVCDHTYYCGLHAIAEASMATRCLFLHVPADEQTFDSPPTGPTMPLDRQIAAVARVLEWLRNA
jgi:pyroglutamyl-peptidase